MDKPDAELRTILEGCTRWDRKSQHQLYRQFYAYGMSVCIRYADSEREAREMLNEGFLRVFKNIKKYDPERPFKPWLRKVLVNAALNYLRRRKKFKPEVQMEEAHESQATDGILSRIAYQELIAMVQSLSLAYRTVFNMYVIDGYTHEEIARELGISVGTSKSNLSKARAKLRELILQTLDSRYA